MAPLPLPGAVLAADARPWRAEQHAGLSGPGDEHRHLGPALIMRGPGVQSSMRDYQVQEMSTAIWAMGTLGRSSEALLEACAQEALRRGFETFAPQAISNFVWGFAVLGYCNNAFLSVRCARGSPRRPRPPPVQHTACQCTFPS